MSLRSLISLRGLIEGLPGGTIDIHPEDMQNLTPPQLTTQLTLILGDNHIQVPAIADGCVIIFDPTSTVTKRLKEYTGVAVTEGILLAKNKWNVLTFDTTPITAFTIETIAADTGKLTTIIFF